MRLSDHRRAAREAGADAGGGTKPLSAADGGGVLAEQINEEHRACVQAGVSALEHAIRAGELLEEMKEGVGHGNWLPWLREHFTGSVTTAQDYMRLARHRHLVEDPNTGRVRYLSFRDARRLIAPERDGSDPEPGGVSDEGGAVGAPVAGKETIRPRGRAVSTTKKSEDRPGRKKAPEVEVYLGDDLPVATQTLADGLGEGKAVALSSDVPAAKAAGEKALSEAQGFLAEARAARDLEQEVHLLLLLSLDPEVREAAERGLGYSSSDEAARRARYEADVLRGADKGEPSLHRVVVGELGGIRKHDGELREEYRQIPPCYFKKDGLAPDEMADQLATQYPQLRVRNERDLIRVLAERRKAG